MRPVVMRHAVMLHAVKSAAAAVSLLAAQGCASVDYDGAKGGRFEGDVWVLWLGEGDGAAGDGRFLFAPDPVRPLRFVRPDGRIVEPQMMYTDGGSIPRVAQAFRGMSPWGYAPAYMAHDWLFQSRRCLNDGVRREPYVKLESYTFEDSARLLAEAIQALVSAGQVRHDDVSAERIAWAVGTPVARAAWEAKGACAGSEVTPADRARAMARFAAPAMASARTARRVGKATPPPAAAPSPRSDVRVIQRLSF